MLICWDLAFPEAFRELIANGAKIIITPTFWTLNDCNPAGLALNPSSEALFLDSMLTCRAFENTCGELEALLVKGVPQIWEHLHDIKLYHEANQCIQRSSLPTQEAHPVAVTPVSRKL